MTCLYFFFGFSDEFRGWLYIAALSLCVICWLIDKWQIQITKERKDNFKDNLREMDMYTKKDFFDLTPKEMTDYTVKGYGLCYVESVECVASADHPTTPAAHDLRLFFTPAALEDQWGDDWNDAPYDCNAGWPYDGKFVRNADGKKEWVQHEILVLNVRMLLENCPELPSEFGGYCKAFSVEMINQGACAWMFFGDRCKPVYAGATPLDVYERIGKWFLQCPVDDNEE